MLDKEISPRLSAAHIWHRKRDGAERSATQISSWLPGWLRGINWAALACFRGVKKQSCGGGFTLENAINPLENIPDNYSIGGK